MPQNSAENASIRNGVWSQIKRFLVFQLKLYVDAFRDLILSFFAIWALIADVIFQLKGDDSLFEGLLAIGRRSERVINLFNQYDETEQGMNSIDGIVREVEDRLRKPDD